MNLTNHVYFNLDGHSNWKDLSNQTVSIFADNYTPVDIDAIPLGDISDVAGTPYDLRNGKYMTSKTLEAVDPNVGGYDHNFCISTHNSAQIKGNSITLASIMIILW